MSIREATPTDGAGLASIYNPYIRDTVITFEEEEVSAADMAARVAEVRGAGFPWLVAEASDGSLDGYAYATTWRTRASYRYSVEVTVYIRPRAHRRGVATALYRPLFARLQNLGFHALIAGISLPNEASVALHEKLGMRKVAHFPDVGWKLGRWVDVGYWQLLLDR